MAEAAIQEEDELRDGPIHLAATRPPMVPLLGIPLSAAVPTLLAASEVQMAVTGLQGLLYAAGIVLAVTVPLRVWVSYDWYAVECLMVWARTSGPALDNRRWGGASVSHFPLKAEASRGMG
jgi:type IV secretory pathway VirB3-like protein